MSGGRFHPFDFATYPRLLNRALRARRLSRDEYVILVRLYAMANRETWLASVTLDQLGDRIAWDRSEDYLYRLLDALKRKAWIEYPTTPGKKQHVYAIGLLWDRAEQSEDGRGSRARRVRASRKRETTRTLAFRPLRARTSPRTAAAETPRRVRTWSRLVRGARTPQTLAPSGFHARSKPGRSEHLETLETTPTLSNGAVQGPASGPGPR